MGGADRVEQRGIEIPHGGGGHGDDVGPARGVVAVVSDDREAESRLDGHARLPRAHPEVDGRHPVVGAIDAEDLTEHAELERSGPLRQEHGDRAQGHAPQCGSY